MTRPIPEGYGTVTPVLSCADARGEIDFLVRAFGGVERFAMPGPDGQRIMHAEVQVGTSVVMLGSAAPEMGCRSARELGGSPAGFYLYVEDVDAAFAKATGAGATAKQPPTDMFWGDRVGTVECPEGFQWTLATHQHDYTPEQIEEGQRRWLESMKSGA
ncbi:MAG: VOC family protein [Planctomycetes bacterium]|nr:VOC family protein [Planctomycetota bacterium]